MEICRVSSNLFKIGQKYVTLHKDPSVFHIVSTVIFSAVQRTHCCSGSYWNEPHTALYVHCLSVGQVMSTHCHKHLGLPVV